MKKRGFLLICLLFLGMAGVHLVFFPDTIEIDSEKNRDTRGIIGETKQITITKEQVYQGDLLLINQQHPVQEQSIKRDIIDLQTRNELTTGYGLLNGKIKLSEEIANHFSNMIAAADTEDIRNFLITSGFRNFEEQDALYHKMGADYALPAMYSEHNSGLSLDVGSSQMKMIHAPEGKWIEENAWKHGFILRYPQDKTNVTGIQYEPWHIRYVGLPHSAIMKEKNLALEEYVDYLKQEKTVSVHVNRKKYMISYHPIQQDTTIHVPMNHHYTVSGNNIDGVIVTVILN